MKRYLTLKTQVILIFSLVSIVTTIVFLVFLESQSKQRYIDQDRRQQEVFLLKAIDMITGVTPPQSDYYGYVYVVDQEIKGSFNFEFISAFYTEQDVAQLIDNAEFANIKISGENQIYFQGNTKDHDGKRHQIITFSSGIYQEKNKVDITFPVRFAFISIILLGNMIIILWATLLVEHIKVLKSQVGNLSTNQFKKPIEIAGFDEISDLSRAIETMRVSIEKNEETKQEMLKNISHDIKTPIAVIKSYTEAIYDGVSDTSDLEIIIKQADILNKKVMQLLELNKLEYLKSQKDFVDVPLKPLFEQIIAQNKYRTQVVFKLESDKSSYFGTQENFYIAFSNIIDNALRYAKTMILIRVSKKRSPFLMMVSQLTKNSLNMALNLMKKEVRASLD